MTPPEEDDLTTQERQAGYQPVEFVGGPCDGINPVHPLMNHVLTIGEEHPGFYQFVSGRYYWRVQPKNEEFTITRFQKRRWWEVVLFRCWPPYQRAQERKIAQALGRSSPAIRRFDA